VARLHQLGGLQPGEGFAHDRPAHFEARHDLAFGRQLVARLQLPVADAAGQAIDDFGHQTARASYREIC
jgi:hypothetical protein